MPDNNQTPLNRIPKEWQDMKLGDAIEELKNGFASGKRDENGIVQIRMNNVTTDGRLIFDSYLKVPIPENINNWLLKKGDFLFNNTNSIDLVGKSTIFNDSPFPCTFSNHFTRLRFKKEMVLPELILYHFLILWKNDYFKSVAIRHVGQSAVHTSYLLKLQIPLPPLPEQRRIAEVLGTVDSAIQKVGGAIERTERLKKGLMQRLLTRGVGHERFKLSKELGTEIPEEWDVVKLEDVTGHVGSGLTPRGGALTYLDHGIPLIRSQNVLMNKLDLSDVAYISKETHKYMARSVVFSGDLLLNITGASIGRVAIIPKSVSEANVNQHVCCIRFSEVIIPIFASYYLSSTNGQNQIMSFQAGATRQGLNYKQVKSILIPLPPLAEQRRIAEILSAADRKLELERRRKEKLERIKNGLMNDLLTGRKRVNMEEMRNVKKR